MDISDEVIRQAGFDPTTRRRHDLTAELTFLRCAFEGPEIFVTFMAANEPYDKQWERAANRAQPISINGRESFIGLNALNKDGCTLVMRMHNGVFIIDTTNKVQRFTSGAGGCDGVAEIGNAVEPVLPKGI